MPITFERNVCCSLDNTISREWLITNGLGGYASGTVAGTLTRLQHGLLVATTDKETVPQLLVAKIDEEIVFDQRTYYLGTNEYQDGTLNPAGFVHMESFHLEEGIPVFTYRLGGIDGVMLEKRIWMPREQNTTCIQYRVVRTSASLPNTGSSIASWRAGDRPGFNGYARSYQYAEHAQSSLMLTLLPFVAHRPYDQPQYGDHNQHFQVITHPQTPDQNERAGISAAMQGNAGCTIRARETSTPYHILALGHPESQTRFIPTGVWYWHFLRRHSQSAGLPPTDDLYLPGVIRARLWPDKDATLTIMVTAEEPASLPQNQQQIHHSYERALDYQRGLTQTPSYFGEGGGAVQTLPILPLGDAEEAIIKSDEFLALLLQAGDHLLTQRALPRRESADNQAFFFRPSERISTITPGYYQLKDSTRETLIALPGLAMATRRYGEAQRILRYLSRHFRYGLLPGRLPAAQQPTLDDTDYDNADTALWYFYALDKYLNATRDYELLDEIYTRLADCISRYIQGTAHGIQVDPADGLLRIGASEHPLTWMNGVVQGVPVTPRTGKPVEINALWYHALKLMHKWSLLLYQQGRIHYTPQQYAEQSELCYQSFNRRFWYPTGGYLYDLVDGPEGNDSRLRPNQLLAISLHHAVLNPDLQATVLDIITQQLLTPYGLRSLAPHEQGYQGQLPENHEELQHALHQGSAWPWLIGPYVDALLRVGDPAPAGHREGVHRTTNPDLYKEYIWHKGLQVLEPFRRHMQEDMLGNISHLYGGDWPHRSGPQIVSALSVGEILRTYKILAHLGVQHFDQVISA